MTENENPYKNKRKHLWIIVGLVVFNLLAYNFVFQTRYERTHVADASTQIWSSLLTFLFTLPILSIVIGLLFGVLPYKKQPFRRRHERASILVLLNINSIVALLLIVNLVMIAMGWYPQEPVRPIPDGLQVEVRPWMVDSPRTTVHNC